jgi:DNA-binding IclR family transcriptional regulator
MAGHPPLGNSVERAVNESAETASQGRDRILSLDKAVAILDLLAQTFDGLLLADISRRTGMNRSTVYRILSSLETNRMVMRDERLRYRLGFLLYNLGDTAKDQNVEFHGIASDHLCRTAEQLGATGFLAVRDNGRALYVAQAVYGDPHYVAYPAGSSLPLHVGAAGRVLLAYAGADEVERYLMTPLEQLTPMTISDPAELRRSLAEIRRECLALTDGDVTMGLGACGAPVHDASGRVLAAVSISGPSDVVLGSGRARIIEAVRALAERISDDLRR